VKLDIAEDDINAVGARAGTLRCVPGGHQPPHEQYLALAEELKRKQPATEGARPE